MTLQELVPAAIEGGFWADRQRLNRDVLIPEGQRRLEAAGNFGNLRRREHVPWHGVPRLRRLQVARGTRP